MKTHPLIICFALLLGMSSDNASANPCDSSYVTDEGVSVTVTHSDGFLDDDVNVQCAVDFAISEGIPTVQLTTGDYYFGTEVIVEGYDGTIRGTGMEERTLVHDHGFEIYGGSPTLEHLQIRSNKIGVEAIADRNCNKPTFISFNRIKIIAHEQGIKIAPELCHFKGGVNIHRSWIEGSDALFLSALIAGTRVNLTNTDFRAEAGSCIFSEVNHIALSAVSNSCVADYMLRLYGHPDLSISDYYLRRNTHPAAEIYVVNDGQPLTIHLQGNRMAKTSIWSGYRVTLSALNNVMDGGKRPCINTSLVTSLISGNTCTTTANRQLSLTGSITSVINQPTWSIITNYPGLLTNGAIYHWIEIDGAGSGFTDDGLISDDFDLGKAGDKYVGVGSFSFPTPTQFCAAGSDAPGTDELEWKKKCNCDGTLRLAPLSQFLNGVPPTCGT